MKTRMIIQSLLFWVVITLSSLAFCGPVWANGINLGILGKINFTHDFFIGLLSIILIDLVLAGDNAVVIALAVKNLPSPQKKKGIIFGAGGAVALRVILTFLVAQLLSVSFLKLVGGVLILWIAVKLFVEGVPEEEFRKEATTFWQAIRIIVIADIVMSTDNILAVAGACKGNFFLLFFGLALSIPFVVFTSTLLSLLMERYPFIIYVGAAVLGRVGGEMIMTDPFIVQWLHPSKVWQYSVEIIGAIGVILAGKLYLRRKISRRSMELVKSRQLVS